MQGLVSPNVKTTSKLAASETLSTQLQDVPNWTLTVHYGFVSCWMLYLKQQRSLGSRSWGKERDCNLEQTSQKWLFWSFLTKLISVCFLDIWKPKKVSPLDHLCLLHVNYFPSTFLSILFCSLRGMPTWFSQGIYLWMLCQTCIPHMLGNLTCPAWNCTYK